MDKSKLNRRFEDFEMPLNNPSLKESVFEELDKKSNRRRRLIIFPTLFLSTMILLFFLPYDLGEYLDNDLVNPSQVSGVTMDNGYSKIESDGSDKSVFSSDIELALEKTAEKLKSTIKVQNNRSKKILPNRLSENLHNTSDFTNKEENGNGQLETDQLKTNLLNTIKPNSKSTKIESLFSTQKVNIDSIDPLERIGRLLHPLREEPSLKDLDRRQALTEEQSLSPSIRKNRVGLMMALGSKQFKHSFSYESSSPTDTVTASALAEGGLTVGMGFVFQRDLSRKWSLEQGLSLSRNTNNYYFSRYTVDVTQRSIPGTGVITSETLLEYKSLNAQFLEHDYELYYSPRLLRSTRILPQLDGIIGIGTTITLDLEDTYYATDRTGILTTTSEPTRVYFRSIDLSARVAYSISRNLSLSIGMNYMNQFRADQKVYGPNDTSLQVMTSITKRIGS